MSLAIIYSRAQEGIHAPLVTVEVHLANGLPALSIVGLPETAVKESKDRVRSALLNTHFDFPARRITINLAPADLPKEGGRFDLPIALGILAASGQIPKDALARYEFVGELALSGDVRPVQGTLPTSMQSRNAGRTLVVPAENGEEAALVSGSSVLTVPHLLAISEHLVGSRPLPRATQAPAPTSVSMQPCFSEVRGQQHAKRALEIAAGGGHSLLLIGPPGTGKSMLTQRLPGILPPMSEAEALETAAIASVSAQGFRIDQWGRRPFRAPHHTASAAALVGGGSNPRPGEISLAHNGVLFLDELPEFERRVLEVLREPLESGRIMISRAARQAEFPASFQLVAAMNPCPCGYLGDASGRCRCTAEQVQRYRARISGPLLDRIDMHIEVGRVPQETLRGGRQSVAESSSQIQQRVAAVRAWQLARAGIPNCALGTREMERYCNLDDACQQLLEQAMSRLALSARAYHRILRVARTIADLAQCESIRTEHISEALAYRRLDRNL